MRNLLLLAAVARALAAQPDPGDLLLRVREKVLNTVDRLPRYLCTQTTDRSQFEPDRAVYIRNCEELQFSRDTRWKPVLTTADRLRLDVGIAGQREIYSWVGENQFADRSLFDIVTEGALSTGYFQGFLSLIFRNDNPEFSSIGEKTVDGRKVWEYGYRVPLEASHYGFQAKGHPIVTAYEGTVLADPETTELVRVTVRTSHLSIETGSCEATTTMNYSRFHLNDADFLLPAETRLDIQNLNGVESQNRTVYSGCHEFLGESTMKFDAPDAPSQAAAVAPAFARIPAGQRFGLALDEDIHVATAAAGDSVNAVMTNDLRDRSKKVLVPNHSTVLCRILRIRRYYGGRDPRSPGRVVVLSRLELLLRLESFVVGNARVPVSAKFEIPAPVPAMARGRLQQRPMVLGPLNSIGPDLWLMRFEHAGDDYVVNSKPASNWVTLAR